MSTLYISHSSRDNNIARDIEERLEGQHHHSVFLDIDPEKGIMPGQSWEQTLYRKLRACQAVIIICTENYLSSKWCFAEIVLARMEAKHIITLLYIPNIKISEKLPSILTDRQIIDMTGKVEEGYSRLWKGLEEEQLLGVVGEWDVSKSPYLGLASYEEKHAPLFFGRDREIQEGYKLISRGSPNLIMVIGASGSGKSSLVKAGILPKLRREKEHWIIVDPFKARTDPFGEFANVLSKAFLGTGEAGKRFEFQFLRNELIKAATSLERSEHKVSENKNISIITDERLMRLMKQIEDIKQNPPEASGNQLDNFLNWSLSDLKSICGEKQIHYSKEENQSPPTIINELTSQLRYLSKDQQHAKVLIVIDQFEELLERKGDENIHDRFLKLLRASIEADYNSFCVVGTMRSDYLESFQNNQSLREIIYESLSLGQMGNENIMKVIKKPAELGRITFEEGLPEQLNDDIQTTDALPLLSFILAKLWEEYRDGNLFEIEEYNTLGRLQGAISKEADLIVDKLDSGRLEDLRKAFLRMARLNDKGDYARKPASREDPELIAVSDILENFVAHRLMFTYDDGEQKMIEVAHESLFRTWGSLKNWFDNNRVELLFRQQIERDAIAWHKREKNEDDLWTGGKLERARELLSSETYEVSELEFIEASIAKADAQKAKNRRRFIAISSVIVALAILATFLFIFGKKNLALANAHENLGEAFFNSEKDPTTALHLAHGTNVSNMGSRIKQKRRFLMGNIYDENKNTSFFERIYHGHKGHVSSIKYSPNGELIISAANKKVIIWDTLGNQIDIYNSDHRIKNAAFHPNGKDYFICNSSGLSKFWDSNVNKEYTQDFDNNQIHEINFLSSGNYIVSTESRGSSVLWDIKRDTLIKLFRNGLIKTSFNGDENLILTISGRQDLFAKGTYQKLTLWNIQGDTLWTKIREDHDFNDATFFPNAKGIILVGKSNLGLILSLDGKMDRSIEFKGHNKQIIDIIFSPSGQELLTSDVEGNICTHNHNGSIIQNFKGHSDVSQIFFSPKGNYVCNISSNGQVTIWDQNGVVQNQFFDLSEGFTNVKTAFSPNEKSILVNHNYVITERKIGSKHKDRSLEEYLKDHSELTKEIEKAIDQILPYDNR